MFLKAMLFRTEQMTTFQIRTCQRRVYELSTAFAINDCTGSSSNISLDFARNFHIFD